MKVVNVAELSYSWAARCYFNLEEYAAVLCSLLEPWTDSRAIGCIRGKKEKGKYVTNEEYLCLFGLVYVEFIY